jgi:penicillin amidase
VSPPVVTTTIRTTTETILVKGAESVALEVKETDVGPVLKSDAEYQYALSWVLYRPGAMVNRVPGFMFATDLDTAIKFAHNTPMPHQNILIADNVGNIAWTVAGRIPARPQWQVSRGTATPVDQLPTGWLDPAKYPLIKIGCAKRPNIRNKRSTRSNSTVNHVS